jgi:hypothetical protein
MPRFRVPSLFLTLVLVCMFSGGPAPAQTLSWSAPSSGFVYDSLTSSLRPVVGFIGSAYLGPFVLDSVDWASLAPNRQSALARRGGDFVWIADLRAPDHLLSLAATVAAPQQALWAADSSRAVLLSADSTQLIWLSGFDANPSIEANWTLDSGSTGWTLLAANTSCETVLLAAQISGGWQIWLASKTAAPVVAASSGHPTAAVFSSSGASAFVTDVDLRRILLLHDLDSAPGVTPILSDNPRLADPVGIALSPDEARLFIVDRTDKMVRIFSSADGALQAEWPVDVAPSFLARVAPHRFLLNQRGSATQPLFFLDTGDPARVSFVPVGE